MAQALATYDSIMSELKSRNFRPLYYLMGDEPYYIDLISNWIAENVMQPEERDFSSLIIESYVANACAMMQSYN